MARTTKIFLVIFGLLSNEITFKSIKKQQAGAISWGSEPLARGSEPLAGCLEPMRGAQRSILKVCGSEVIFVGFMADKPSLPPPPR